MSQSKVDSGMSKKDVSKEQVSQLKRPTLSKIGTYAPPKVIQENRSDSVSRSSTSSRDHGTILTADTEQFIIGQKVYVGGVSPGQIAYIGETHFAPGEWAGVVLDEPNGKNDGCVAGKRYFQCEAKKGIFSRLTRLTLHPLEGAFVKPAHDYSPDRSRTVSPTPSTQSVLNRSMGGRHGLTLGDRVIVSSGFGSRPGTLRFLGETQFASGNWCGIELDDATGKNDGSVEGVKYFECKPKYGIFVPVAKVSLSPSSKKSRLSRTCSKESLTSVGTMNSIATTNTSRLRMQRYSMSMKQPPQSASKSSFSMQDLLREKQNHIEQLMIERDMEQEDAQNQALQFQKIILELKSKIDSLEKNLEEEKNKTEDLQLSIEEANFCGDELNAQTQVYKEKITDLEQRLRAVISGDTNIQLAVDPVQDEVVVKTEVTSTSESKYDIQQQNNQYSFNQNVKSKLESLDGIKALNDFRDLLRKIKDLNSSETTYQEELNRFIKDPDEIRRIHSIKVPLHQMGDTFLKDLCESLALAIKEFNLMSIENKTTVTKCIDYENALITRSNEIDRLENEKNDISKKLKDATSNLKNLSEVNEKIRKEKNAFEESIKSLEREKSTITEKLGELTLNCEKFVVQNEQLKRELELHQENTKQIEKEKLSASQKLEDVLSNCKSLSEINEKMQTELKTNAEKSNVLKGEQLDVSRKFEDISFKCSRLVEENEKLLKDLQESEDKLRVLETKKLNMRGENNELLTKFKISTALNEKLQKELEDSNKKLFELKKENIDISQKLNEMSTNCKTLSDANGKLLEDLSTYMEKIRNTDGDKIEAYRKLEEVSLNCTINEEQIEKLKHKLLESEEKLSRILDEKENISTNLEELTMNHKSLSEFSEKLKEELNVNKEKLSLLESEKISISKKLDEKTENCGKLVQNLKAIEVEKFDTEGILEEIKIKYESLLKQAEDINQNLKTSNEKTKLLESERFDISQKLKEMQSTLKSTLEQNESLQRKLKTVEENSNQLEKEKFEISRNFEEVSLSHKALLKQNQKMQDDLKANEDKLKLLEENNFDISLKLKDAESNFELLSDVKNKLQEEFLCKNEGSTSYCNDLLQQNEKLQNEIKSLEEQKKALEVEKFNLLRKLEEVTSALKSTSQSNEIQRQELQAIDVKYKLLENEKFDISQRLEEGLAKYNNVLETINKLEDELNSNKEKTKRLEEEKFETSNELADRSAKLQTSSERNSNLQNQLKNLEDKIKAIEAQKIELTGNLKKATSDSESLSEENYNLKQELLKKEEALKQIEEKMFNLTQKLAEVTYKNETLIELCNKLEKELKIIQDTPKELESLTGHCKKLENINEKLQQNLEFINEKCKQNDIEKTEISQKLSDIASSYGDLGQNFEKLKQELKITEEKTIKLEIEKAEISGNLIDATLQIAHLSDLSESFQQKNSINEKKFKLLEEKKLETLQKLEKISELNNKLSQDLKTFEERVSKLETEKLDLSESLMDATFEVKNLSDQNEKLQQNLKESAEKYLQLEKQKLDIHEKLGSSYSSSENLNELVGNMQRKLESQVEKSIAIQNENSELSEKLEKATESCKNLSELNEKLQNDLKNNKEEIDQLKEKLQKQKNLMEPENILGTTVKIVDSNEEVNTSIDLSTETFLSNESFLKLSSNSSILEMRKAHQNVHNDFVIGRLHICNQLQDIYQHINSIKSHIQNLNQDIQSLPSQNRIRTDIINAAEEKSCKLNYDFTDLARRFEALVMINEKYPSLKDSISKSLLDEAKKNIKEQEACMEFDPSDEIDFLQNVVISYQLVLKARDVEIANTLITKSSFEPLSLERRPEEIVLIKLQSDLDSTRKLINKLEELNLILKCLRYFQFKISKQNVKVNAHFNNLKNDKDSLEDICKLTLQLRDAEKQLEAECADLIKILVDSMETFESSKQSLDQSKTKKSPLAAPILCIEKSIEKLNNVMNSNSELLDLLCKKVKSFEEKTSDMSSRSLFTDITKLDANTITESKVENMDEKSAQINFLHSIIADMQQKNDKLKDKIETLEAFSTDTKKSFMYEMISKRKPAPRMFCDICEHFDIHETEDCPMQESNGGDTLDEKIIEESQVQTDGGTTKILPRARKYCENCEEFGDHETKDCYAGLN